MKAKVIKEPPIFVHYCVDCGSQLRVRWINERYDIDTGEPTGDLQHRCPIWRPLSSHTNFKTDIHGSSYAFES